MGVLERTRTFDFGTRSFTSTTSESSTDLTDVLASVSACKYEGPAPDFARRKRFSVVLSGVQECHFVSHNPKLLALTACLERLILFS
jgi:hypothetical protein